MGLVLVRLFSIGIAVGALPFLAEPRRSVAQPREGNAAPSDAARAAAKKLSMEGNAAFEARSYAKAIALYMRAFTLEPHPLLLFNVGQSHRLAGCPERAASFYERYLALDPQGAQAGTAKALRAAIKEGRERDGANCSSLVTPEEPRPEDAPTATGRLKLRSEPSGLVVMLDGMTIGITPIERDVASGPHTLILFNGSTRVGERKLQVVGGAELDVTMDGSRALDTVDPLLPQRPSRLPSIFCWVGGAGAVAGGSVALYYGGKSGPDEKYVYRGATPAGVALVSAGAVSIGVGVWLWMRGSRERESVPVATIGPGGGYFGWHGRF